MNRDTPSIVDNGFPMKAGTALFLFSNFTLSQNILKSNSMLFFIGGCDCYCCSCCCSFSSISSIGKAF